MKSFAVLLSLLTLAIANPIGLYGQEQEQLLMELPTRYPGYSLDLSAMRLVELEGQSPVWMSELEKVRTVFLTHLSRKLSVITVPDQAQSQGRQLLGHVLVLTCLFCTLLTRPQYRTDAQDLGLQFKALRTCTILPFTFHKSSPF
jgi:hypothetical protein